MEVGQSVEKNSNKNLADLALIYLRLGVTAFGGPPAHIAMMHREFVDQQQWLTEQEFTDLLGAVNLIPGPNSTELAIHIGRVRAGVKGLVIAGVCFILPAMILVSLLAWAYVRFGSTPTAGYLLYGIKPVIIAVIVQALFPLVKSTVKNPVLGVCGVLSLGAALVSAYPLIVVFGCGLVVGGIKWIQIRTRENLFPLLKLVGLVAAFVALAFVIERMSPAKVAVGLMPLFGFFLKVGSILYGSGYVLLAYLNSDLITRWGWLTRAQLLDAVAVGQFTPGPVFTTATFIGFILGGPWGAVLATVGIFLPSFVFVALSGRILPQLRESQVAGAFMDGVNVASLALMMGVAYVLARTALIDWITWALALTSLAILWKFKINSAWLVLAGGLIGLALSVLKH